MSHVPCCNLHPERRMVLTSVMVRNAGGALETFEAYQCRKWDCTRHYVAGRGYFDISDPTCDYLEDPAARTHRCPQHSQVLFARWSESGNGYLYQCPVADCDFTEPFAAASRREMHFTAALT